MVARRPDLIALDLMFPESVSAGFEIKRQLGNLPMKQAKIIRERGLHNPSTTAQVGDIQRLVKPPKIGK